MTFSQKDKFSYLDEYKIIKTLGSGFHAQVKLGMDEKGNLYAIKKYKKETANQNTLQHQINVMRVLKQENIVKLVDVRVDATYKKRDDTEYKCFAIILEYVEGGELFDFVAETGHFSDKVARTYFNQLMNGLYYMHCKGFVHRDIKPENILLSKEFTIKIADFGFSCRSRGKTGTGVLHTKLGTEGYMAPQISSKNYNGIKADIFSAAVILFIMYSGIPPFQKANPNDPYYRLIKEKKYSTFWKAHSKNNTQCYFEENFKDLFVRMTAFDPDQRPSIEQIAGHPWIKGPICTKVQIKNQFEIRKRKLDLINQRRIQELNEKKQGQLKDKNQKNQKTGAQEKFKAIYLEQMQKKRNLQLIYSKNSSDFVVEQNIAYTASLLKYFLQNKKIIVEDQESLYSCRKILNMVKFVDKDDCFQVIYELLYEQGQELFYQSVEIIIRFWQLPKKKIVLSIDHISGEDIYFKKIQKQLGKLFDQECI